MKNALVMMFVLVAASLASATTTMWIGTSATSSTPLTSITVAPSTNFNLFIWASSDLVTSKFEDPDTGDITATGGGITSAQFVVAVNESKLGVQFTDPALAILGNSAFMGGIASQSFGSDAGLTLLKGAYLNLASYTDAFGATRIGTVKLKTLASGLPATVSLYQGNIEANQSYLGGADSTKYTGNSVVTVVPEPMTMALLGLGGLFFARKK